MNLPVRFYDLTQPIYHNCPGWPGHRLTTVDWEFQRVNHGFNAERVSFTTHVATHIDAPYHFLAGGKTLDQLPIDSFAGPVVFFDLRETVRPDSPITPADLEPGLDRVRKGDIAIVCTGYGRKYGFGEEYLRAYPYMSGPGAELLIKAGVKGVGTDALSWGGWGSDEKGRPPHLAVLPHGVWILEGLIIPDELLDGKRRYLTCFPLLLKGCGGAPARAVVHDFD
ncbi:MAG: cyclase family protein [Planctomycetota bacterium]|jgi:kynurenine formamidase|nr:cyclase family protein [Planctomycetota bacterium]